MRQATRRAMGVTGVSDGLDLGAVWTATIEDLSDGIDSAQQRAYLRLTRLRAIVEDTALIAVPDAFTRDVIETKLRPAITEALSRRLGRPVQVAVTVRAPEEAPPAGYLSGYPPVPQQPEAVPPPLPQVPAARVPEPTLFDAALLDGGAHYPRPPLEAPPPAMAVPPPPHRAPVAAGTGRDDRRPPPATATGSTPSTCSRRSSSARPTGSPTRPRSR